MRNSFINDTWLTTPFVISNKRIFWPVTAVQNHSSLKKDQFVTNGFENNCLENCSYTVQSFLNPDFVTC